MKTIGHHFTCAEEQTQLTVEWNQFKYHLEKMKDLQTTTPTEYCLKHILQLITPFGPSINAVSRGDPG